MTTRRRFLKSAAAGAAIVASPAIIRSARAADSITFSTPFGYDPTFIDVMNAVSGGHFAREGLDVKVIGPPGNAEAFQLVVAGQVQFSYIASIDFIRTVATRSAPFYAFAALSQRVGFNIVSLKDKPVRSGADLRGKTVGVLSVGGLSELLVQVAMAKAGVRRDEANIVVAGNSPGEVELIRKGRLDCFICNLPIVVTLKRIGEPLEYLNIDSIIPAPGLLYFCTKETAETKPELVLRLLRALKASVVEIMDQPLAPIFQRAAKDYDIPRMNDLASIVAVQEEVTRSMWLAEGRENLLRNVPRLWQSAVDGLREIGIADVKDASTLYTNKFVDQVFKT
ncbi:MAG TPA: ABC transporter substrate-binding protein [Stellaceae bacterium]|nr:ABC transporter substrate-binding protein [Stellaceae bacterium]